MTRGFRSDGDVVQARLTDISAKIVRESDLAWLVSDGDVEAWLPKSQVERNGDGTFTMPEWLATEKGLA